MVFDLVITNGTIVTGSGVFKGSVAISDGTVAAVAAAGTELPGKSTVDAEGLMVLPGLIDAHSHAGHGDPDRENFTAYSRACAAGGITTFIDMPLSNPSTLTPETLGRRSPPPARPARGLRPLWRVVPGYLHHVESMVKEGAGAFKSFTCRCSNYPMTDDGTLLEGMTILEKTGGILSVHAENDTLIQNLTDRLVAEGKNGPRAFLDSHPPIRNSRRCRGYFSWRSRRPAAGCISPT